MEVIFHRTGERHYAVSIHREGFPAIEMNPAPGYHAILPHDLLHFIIERALDLQQGIFGQVAAGGHGGMFRRGETIEESRRDASRRRRRAAKRGDKLYRADRDEMAQSERAVYICLHTWLAHSDSPRAKAAALRMAPHAKRMRAGQPTTETRALSDETVARIFADFDEFSARWSKLGVGESIELMW